MRISRYIRDAAVFAPCYVALDWASYVYPLGPFNITPWNPQPALAIVWMLLGGLHYLPAVLVTIFAADVVIRNAPGGYEITVLTAVTLACGYAAIAWLLHVFLSPVPSLHSTRQLTFFSIVTIGGTAVVGAVFIAVLWSTEFIARAALLEAWLQFWVGDGVGVLVTAPLLLAVADAQRRHELVKVAQRPETMLQAAALAATVWVVFAGLRGDPSRHFYLLFLPLIWIAIRSGMSGAVIATAIIQLGVVIGIHADNSTTLPVLELQAFVAALTLTALYLGMTVDERQRTAENLRQTLRLAAAGEMAGALAHEVNQPLTALGNYGRSAQLLLAKGGAALDQLPSVIEKMLAEGQRAGEVVRRLRDFFRTGTTRLEAVPVSELVAAAQTIAHQTSGSRRISITTRVEGELSPVFVDRLQVELILRNLISNAIEAMGDQAEELRLVSVLAKRHGAHHIRLIVEDNGPGVPPGERDRLFEPFSSGKSSGMGLGLAVSRAIAEAHGGSLEAHPSEHGEFHLVLPCIHNP
jgi:two-component system, LuxR family, sensor kinase FixL